MVGQVILRAIAPAPERLRRGICRKDVRGGLLPQCEHVRDAGLAAALLHDIFGCPRHFDEFWEVLLSRRRVPKRKEVAEEASAAVCAVAFKDTVPRGPRTRTRCVTRVTEWRESRGQLLLQSAPLCYAINHSIDWKVKRSCRRLDLCRRLI
mmetsp:Transcript_1833/g.5072  ORF Transcript_1833/g.5072 Transcript_1833/m.5072 type:complete len:151 (+) Transcript_1833:177-629(+)